MREHNKITIAVVLITYNQQDYIIEALEGIRTQSRAPNEVVIADDGSTDNTQVIINEYVKTHNLERSWCLLFSPANRGVNENLQNAIRHTTSEIIIGMAGDDISLPLRCKLTEEMFLNSRKVAAVLLSGFKISPNGEVIQEINEADGGVIDDPLPFARRGYLGILPIGMSFRRELFFLHGGLPFDVPNEDDQTIYRAIIFGGILCSSARVFKYRVHEKSASSWIRDINLVSFIKSLDYAMHARLIHHKYWLDLTSSHDCKNKKATINILKLRIQALEIIECKVSFLKIISNLRIISKALTLKEMLLFLFGPTIYFYVKRIKNLFFQK
jgi:glycosyltransferase involved in cell wall biosynthesis